MVGLTRNLNPKTSREDPELFMVSRKQWNAHPPGAKVKELKHPVSKILFTHTGTSECHTFQECKRTLKKLQFEHMDTLGHNDITHNFMIGGDGWIFEGRGWATEPDMDPMHCTPGSQSLQVAYIGDFEDQTPPPQLMKAGMEILMYATRKQYMFYFFSAVHLN